MYIICDVHLDTYTFQWDMLTKIHFLKSALPFKRVALLSISLLLTFLSILLAQVQDHPK